MPVVKKLKPIDFITNRDLVLSALAIYAFEIKSHNINSHIEFPGSEKQTLRSEFFRLKSKFDQEFKVDYKSVLTNSVLLVMDKDKIEGQLDFSHKDISKLIEIYDSYISFLKKSEQQPLKLKYSSLDTVVGVISVFMEKSKKNPQWFYKGFVYEVQGHYSDDEIKLLILEDFDKERRMFEKLRAKFDDTSSEDIEYDRPRIPEKVRIEVWRRDGGKCARCGSREKLEYDHIVPISKGGSNTARNIELLCEKCNRSKSNNVV